MIFVGQYLQNIGRLCGFIKKFYLWVPVGIAVLGLALLQTVHLYLECSNDQLLIPSAHLCSMQDQSEYKDLLKVSFLGHHF